MGAGGRCPRPWRLLRGAVLRRRQRGVALRGEDEALAVGIERRGRERNHGGDGGGALLGVEPLARCEENGRPTVLAVRAAIAEVGALAGEHVVDALDPVVVVGVRFAGDQVADAVHGADGAGGHEARGAFEAHAGAWVGGGQGGESRAEVWYAA